MLFVHACMHKPNWIGSSDFRGKSPYLDNPRNWQRHLCSPRYPKTAAPTICTSAYRHYFQRPKIFWLIHIFALAHRVISLVEPGENLSPHHGAVLGSPAIRAMRSTDSMDFWLHLRYFK